MSDALMACVLGLVILWGLYDSTDNDAGHA